MWKLGIEDDQGNKTVVNLVRDEYSIGRSEENTVRLTERNISRHHALLKRNGSGWLLEDKSSYNGCFVNGVRVADMQRLDHGDLVQLGDYRLEVVDEAATAGFQSRSAGGGEMPTSVSKGHALLGQPDRLVMLAGPTPGAEFALTTQRIVIGRGEECDISINHASVSRVHSEIHALGDGRYEIIDRESANGIRVNGVELQRSLIDARDTLELGDVVLKFIPAGQIYRAGADESQQIGALAPLDSERMSPPPGVESRITPSGLPSGLKIVAALAALGLLVVLGMVAFSAKTKPEAEVTAAIVDPATRILDEAKELLDQGQFEAAHEKLATLPADSNARESALFREIEAKWADALFEQAAAESDPAKKRELLDRIAKSTTVDSGRRNRAATEVVALGGDGVELTDLPPAPSVVLADPAVTKRALPDGIVRSNPFDATSQTKPAPIKKEPKPPATKEAPAGPNVKDDATSGNRAQMTAAKNSLKAKVAAGKATEQEQRLLRGLCRQLGDMSCAY
jgi:ABC transport system ATP-binding/permease protein